MKKIEKLTFTEWMKKYRPDGIGRIIVNDSPPIKFTEVICDIGNEEIFPYKCSKCSWTGYSKDRCSCDIELTENTVYVFGSYALCKKCADLLEKE